MRKVKITNLAAPTERDQDVYFRVHGPHNVECFSGKGGTFGAGALICLKPSKTVDLVLEEGSVIAVGHGDDLPAPMRFADISDEDRERIRAEFARNGSGPLQVLVGNSDGVNLLPPNVQHGTPETDADPRNPNAPANMEEAANVTIHDGDQVVGQLSEIGSVTIKPADDVGETDGEKPDDTPPAAA